MDDSAWGEIRGDSYSPLTSDEIQRRVKLAHQPLGAESLSASRAFRLFDFPLPLPLPRLVSSFLRRRARIRELHLTTHARSMRQELNRARRGRGRHHRRVPRYSRRIVRHGHAPWHQPRRCRCRTGRLPKGRAVGQCR